MGEVVPDDHHGNAAGESHQDDSRHVQWIGVEEEDRQETHEDRADRPVLDKGESEDAAIAEDLPKFVVSNACKRGIHHQDEPDGDRDVRGS